MLALSVPVLKLRRVLLCCLMVQYIARVKYTRTEFLLLRQKLGVKLKGKIGNLPWETCNGELLPKLSPRFFGPTYPPYIYLPCYYISTYF